MFDHQRMSHRLDAVHRGSKSNYAHGAERSHLAKHMHAHASGTSEDTQAAGGERTQMCCDFNHLHGQVITGNLTTPKQHRGLQLTLKNERGK